MRLLIDTHILLWALADDPRLQPAHRDALALRGSEIHLSAASVWEITIKRALGKLDVPTGLFETALAAGCRPLAITFTHAEAAGALPPHHADPFDRMLIAQARAEGLTIVTSDTAFAAYDVARL